MFLISITAFITINKNRAWTKGPVLSRTDYRIFACGEELLFQADIESLAKKRNGLFARSELGSIIADGTPTKTDDVLLTSFFEASGGALEFSDNGRDIFRIPTVTGIREFHSGDLCNGEKAKLYVIHHRVDASTKPWSIVPRVIYKYFDHVLTNNYGKVPPGDCLVFIFDSEDALKNPWPTCASHDDAVANGKLILKK